MADNSPIILWFRRDLRLSDHPALDAAARSGRPVIPVLINDDLVQGLGAAPKWRLEKGVRALSQSLRRYGSRLILRKGPASLVLNALVAETRASAVYWSRAYDPASIERDRVIKACLGARGVSAKSFPGHLLFEPWQVATRAGEPFRVFTPMWRAVQTREVPWPLPAPSGIRPPQNWPVSEKLSDWRLGQAVQRGGLVLRSSTYPGEDAARDALNAFLGRMAAYMHVRDNPGQAGTSGLSEYLSLGEISPRSVWHGVRNAGETGAIPTEGFLRQLVWREFAYHLMFNWPHILTENWKQGWDRFSWRQDPDAPDVVAWQQGRTGVPMVDAGLRQMYVTGRMHNRARMIVASYLTKHLLTHWRIGLNWFAECLTDWDPAANAMGWQWIAGSGPDAAPFFRVFNPETQRQKFDPHAAYINQWIAEGQKSPPPTALSYFEAIPQSWGMNPSDRYARPAIDLAAGRHRALSAYEALKNH